MGLLISSTTGLLKAASNPVNLKFAALAGLVAASTAAGTVSALYSGDQIKGFLNTAFSPVSKFLKEKVSPVFVKFSTGAKGIGQGFKSLWSLYKDSKSKIDVWIKKNLNFATISSGWKEVKKTISDWFDKARQFVKDDLWNFIKEKILTLFKDWDQKRAMIFQFGSFIKETLIPMLKTLFKSEENGKESRLSQFLKLISSEGGIKTVIDTAQLYIANREQFGEMDANDMTRIMDRLFDNHEKFDERVLKLLDQSNLTKQKILETLDPQGFLGFLDGLESVMEKALTKTFTPPLGAAGAKSTAKAVSHDTIEWWKWAVKTFVIPAFTTTCETTESTEKCFESPL